KKKRNTKEAAKIREYITTVERGLQTSEILQSILEKDATKRQLSLKSISLKEIDRFHIQFNIVHCIVSVLLPTSEREENEEDNNDSNEMTPLELRRYHPHEVIISIVDDVKSEAI